QSELVALLHVHVDADEDLVAVVWSAEFVGSTRIVTVSILRDVDNLLNVAGGAPGLSGRSARRIAGRRILAAPVHIAEEERPVLDDRAPDTEANLLILERPDFRVLTLVEHRGNRPHQLLVTTEVVRGSAEVVCAALRDCVDAA